MSNEDRKVLRTNDDNKQAAKRGLKSRAHKLHDATTRSDNKSTGCNLDEDFDKDEENFILSNVKLTADDLKLKNENSDLFWQKVAETVRAELSETLEDNQQLHEIKKSMEQDNKDLLKEQIKLTKLANEADEICKSFLNNQNDVDDSGIND